MSEATLKRRIKAALEGQGCVVYPQPATPLGVTGRPDLIICAPRGRYLALEVKTEHGRLSPAQEHQLARINAAGGVARAVRSVEQALSCLQDTLKST